jgi:hypothetical protein
MSTYPNIALERWSLGLSTADNLTEFVTSVAWSHSTTAPWGTIDAVLKLPRRQWLSRLPALGDWLVVRDMDTGKALQWGYLVDRSTGITQTERGHVDTQLTTLRAVSWMDLLGRISVYADPGISATKGTIMSTNRWTSRPWRALLETVSDRFSLTGVPKGLLFGQQRNDPGRALALFLQELDLPALPFGTNPRKAPQGGTEYVPETLRHAVRVVHNENTSVAYAPLRGVEAVPGYRLDAALFQIAAMVRDTSVRDLIVQTFSADVNMVEMFPSLEDPGLVQVSGDARDSELQRQIQDDFDEFTVQQTINEYGLDVALDSVVFSPGADLYGALRAMDGDTAKRSLEDVLSKPLLTAARRGKLLEAARSGGRRFVNQTAAKLGQNPVLVYRMRPWRVMSIGDMLGYVFDDDKNKDKGGFKLKLVKEATAKGFEYDLETFKGTTWDPKSAIEIESGAISSVSFGVSDDNHVNAVTVGLPFMPDSPTSLMQRLGLPLIQRFALARRGVRMFRPAWPFMPPTVRVDTNLMAFMRTIAMLGVQFMMLNDRFESGTVEFARYMPLVRHGELIDIELPFGAPPGSVQRAGATKSDAPARMIAYVESVSHSVTVDPARGPIHASTRVLYSRGLFNESERAFPFTFSTIGGQRG